MILRASELEPRSVYWITFACPCCGRRTRASTLLRYWNASAREEFEDAEAMFTVGKGFKRIENKRDGLWKMLDQVGPFEGRRLRETVGVIFEALAARLEEHSRAARAAARRARYGSGR